ncbi:MAG: hypothetical protein ACKV1O_21925 [Saprospiraceae bacterium]
MKLLLIGLSLLGLANTALPLPGQSKNSSSEVHRLLDSVATAASSDQYSIVRKLTRYPIQEFDRSAQKKISDLLNPEQAHLREWVLLAGFLGLESPLRQLLTAEALPKTLQQTIRFALVRCGDEQQLQKMMQKVRTIPVNDDFADQLVPLLVYTRRKVVTDYLLELIQKDDRDCTPADAETPGAINCAYRILEYLAPVIRDFPLKLDGSGDLAVDDYPAALELARVWILEQKGAYALEDTTY